MGCGRSGTRSQTTRGTALSERTATGRRESKKGIRREHASGSERRRIEKESGRRSREEICKRNDGAEGALRARITNIAPGTRRCDAAGAHNRATNQEGARLYYFECRFVRRRRLQNRPNAAPGAAKSC